MTLYHTILFLFYHHHVAFISMSIQDVDYHGSPQHPVYVALSNYLRSPIAPVLPSIHLFYMTRPLKTWTIMSQFLLFFALFKFLPFTIFYCTFVLSSLRTKSLGRLFAVLLLLSSLKYILWVLNYIFSYIIVHLQTLIVKIHVCLLFKSCDAWIVLFLK